MHSVRPPADASDLSISANGSPDPFGDSFLKILPHPDREHVAIWGAAGQDGQCLFWARRDGSQIIVDHFGNRDTTTMPSFNRSGDRFLVVADDNELRQYGFPQGPLLGKMQWPIDDMDNQIGDMVLFVNFAGALLPSTADRLYLVDLTKMAVADEIGIRGHEARRSSENLSQPERVIGALFRSRVPAPPNRAVTSSPSISRFPSVLMKSR
jgi:hypothetical protein